MPTDAQSRNTTLYYRQGGSDKEYHVSVEPQGAGFVVNFAFGRRGSTLQTGAKTAQPVDYQTALKVYDKLVGAKMAKGYTPGRDRQVLTGGGMIHGRACIRSRVPVRGGNGQRKGE